MAQNTTITGPSKIMIIRHAEKPGTYGEQEYSGINSLGQADSCSLVTMGWERAGAIANLFCPDNGNFQNSNLAKPDYLCAANPGNLSNLCPSEKNGAPDGPSKRPYETVQALWNKLGGTIYTGYSGGEYTSIVQLILGLSPIKTVLISWQHQFILPYPTDNRTDSIVDEFFSQTATPVTPASLGVPSGPWPADRYDMVFVLERSLTTGYITSFTQVPQMLLAGDRNTFFPAS